MAVYGPIPKSHEQRVREGCAAHRPLPAPRPQIPGGAPERPKGMSARARAIWDQYIDRMGLCALRPSDAFALRRLCEDVAELEEMRKGQRQMLARMRREAREKHETLAGGAAVAWAMTHEGRRLALAINQVAGRVFRAELQFGLTPIAAARLESGAPGPFLVPSPGASIESKLCG